MGKWRFVGNIRINFISEWQIEQFSRESGANIICILPEKMEGNLDWLQIILNERYASFGFWVTEELYCQVGGENNRLVNGKGYELLIRLAQKGRAAYFVDDRVDENWAATSDFYTDAYVLSRYEQDLRNASYYQPFLENCVYYIEQCKDGDLISYLEDMLCKRQKYWGVYQATQPFLLLMTKTSCYNVVNDMAQNLARGLSECGKNVEIYNLAHTDSDHLVQFVGKHYQAVIGFQNKLLECYLKDSGCYFTDLIHGPKIQILFDHPFWFHMQLNRHGKEVYFLTHDETYVEFIREYASTVAGCFLMPLGGTIQKTHNRNRDLDVVFMGTYWDYREYFAQLKRCNRTDRRMAARYLKYLRKWTNQPAEAAFNQMLLDYGIWAGKEEIARMMYGMGNVHRCIIDYYRERIIRILLDAGIYLHVYGQSWKNSPFADCRQLICHDEVAAERSSEILQRAKISLNILSWHKGGCNERIINSMLAGATVVTEKSSYIEKHFADGRELCCYDLEELDKLPDLIKGLLKQDDFRERIADSGRRKAEKEYSVGVWAERMIALIEQINMDNLRRK
ncbi:MAG: glycosyltransferase family 1 protein [Lachnospiraceae bacterium]|nr:glycosyltransferase family 1 protein [Lachnospiraceae bacterium]